MLWYERRRRGAALRHERCGAALRHERRRRFKDVSPARQGISILHRIQHSDQISGIPGPLLAVLGQQPQDQVVKAQPVGQFRAQLARRLRLLLQVLVHPALGAVRVKAGLAGEHLVEDAAQSVEVRAAVQ